jgi:hypothetical protein
MVTVHRLVTSPTMVLSSPYRTQPCPMVRFLRTLKWTRMIQSRAFLTRQVDNFGMTVNDNEALLDF